ncbi:MAG TPA: pitrilysin family protein [Polyangiaceae bacterium]|nr:pitrilysin family protein [Polyangiaceae bacterium]
MPIQTAHSPSSLGSLVERLNQGRPELQQLAYVGQTQFGPKLRIERFRMGNGLSILLVEEHAAPTVAYHTWFKVGSRNERPGKTGIAHLFEHLMFNETEGLAAGEFDRQLEELGAESNASTWLDWTHYDIAIPSAGFERVVELEAERMNHLVLRTPQVESEKEVVMNERRYRVEDDVEGALSELLWSTAFELHPYRWPTIGWMSDIESFDVDDCNTFYRTFYAPNNATLVVVGDVVAERALRKLQDAYGGYTPAPIPDPPSVREPEQRGEKRLEVTKLTPTWKLNIGYHSPALHHADHLPLSVLSEVLFGGRSSRLLKTLVRDLELASDVRASLSPLADPGLFEIFVSAREGVTAERLLEVVDAELDRVLAEPITDDELLRATARIELSLLQGLTNNEGKASTIGFYEVVLGNPIAGFERLAALSSLRPDDLTVVARRYLTRASRTVILVRPQTPSEPGPEDDDEDDGDEPITTPRLMGVRA